MSKISKELSDIYDSYERARAEASTHQSIAKECKNELVEKIKESGLDSVVVSGLDIDAVKLSVEMVERDVLSKKMVAESLGLKVKDLKTIDDWVKLTNDGLITQEVLDAAKVVEEREQLTVEPFDTEVVEND